LDGLHVLYVGRSEAGRLAKLKDEARKRSVLLVSEGDDAIDQGSVIAFVLSRRRVRFDISVAGATKSGLTLSSRLLSVARTVVTAGS
ncbi:MAG TPA: YfiR family protein, partial [Candidatus Nitrosocosmicus sp.]|nr:YfiR family protein [Candidatus Nitrosocosmicus sp.]